MTSALLTTRSLRYVLCACFVIIIILTGLYLPTQPNYSNHDFLTFQTPHNSTIADIMEEMIPPAGSIFFTETTHLLGEKDVIDVNISFRRACAVESSAKSNPDLYIYILYTTPIKLPNASLLETPEYAALKQIYKLKNVRIRSMNVSRFVHDTPVEELFTSGRFNTSQYPQVHLSDILRLVVLWRYGGTYLDMDMVVTKSINNLGKNYCVMESGVEDKLNNAQITLENNGVGREITTACLRKLTTSFNGKGWADNGPQLLTDVVRQVCEKSRVSSIKTVNDCRGLTILPYWTFNPYDWRVWSAIFNSSFTEKSFEIMKKPYAIHIYGHANNKLRIYKNQSFVVYAEVAKQYCPGSYYNSGEFF